MCGACVERGEELADVLGPAGGGEEGGGAREDGRDGEGGGAAGGWCRGVEWTCVGIARGV